MDIELPGQVYAFLNVFFYVSCTGEHNQRWIAVIGDLLIGGIWYYFLEIRVPRRIAEGSKKAAMRSTKQNKVRKNSPRRTPLEILNSIRQGSSQHSNSRFRFVIWARQIHLAVGSLNDALSFGMSFARGLGAKVEHHRSCCCGTIKSLGKSQRLLKHAEAVWNTTLGMIKSSKTGVTNPVPAGTKGPLGHPL